MATYTKRCHYEVLGLEQDAAVDEIKRAYKKGALRWHPDKNLSDPVEAELRFKEIQEAFEVLSDENERAWYDGHREAILRGGAPAGGEGDNENHDSDFLLAFFSASCFKDYSDDAEGFYTVYSRAFQQIVAKEPKEEQLRPEFGSSKMPVKNVEAFYTSWSEFVSARTFAWSEKWNLNDAENRQIRRLMEADNKKDRATARKAYNTTVRNLVAFVKKRDKRFIEAQQQRLARERALQEEKAATQKSLATARQAMKQENRASEAQRLKEQEAARFDRYGDMDDLQPEAGKKETELLECVACDKTFKSDKQWQNHEQSAKHKQMVAALKQSLQQEEAAMGVSSKATESQSSSTQFTCVPCHRIFPTKKKLQQHQKTPQHAAAIAAAADDNDEDEEDEDEGEGESESGGEEDAAPVAEAVSPPAVATAASVESVASAMQSASLRDDDDQSEDEEQLDLPPMAASKRNQDSGSDSEAEAPRPSAKTQRPAAKLSAKQKQELRRKNKAEKEKKAPAAAAAAAAADEDSDDNTQAPRGRTNNAKNARGKKGAAAAAAADVDLQTSCGVCAASFASRTQLFAHIKSSGHAMLKKQ